MMIDKERDTEKKGNKMLKIAIDENTQELYTDISRNEFAQWIVNNLPAARFAVKNGEFSDVPAAMACTPFDLDIDFHTGAEHLKGADPYALAIAAVMGYPVEDVLSGGLVSWFWLEGPGSTGMTLCRSSKGVMAKVRAY